MILSTEVFRETEFGYRAASLFYGIATIVFLFVITGSILAPLTLFFSLNWWLSSQMALMDTALSFFLLVSFGLIYKYLESKKIMLLSGSGFFLGLAFLTKGQPAVIMLVPFLFLLVTKKISIREAFIAFFFFLLPVLPWVVFSGGLFGYENLFKSILGFGFERAVASDTSQIAPFYWYVRWWIRNYRVPFIVFSVLSLADIILKRLDFKKILILVYFLAALAVFSFSANKVWWYVLPLEPIIALYIFESFGKSAASEKRLFNMSVIIMLSGLPFYFESSFLAICYVFIITTASLFIYFHDFRINKNVSEISVLFSLLVVFLFSTQHFPSISPAYPETKTMGQYLQKLPSPKCLYVRKMPYESLLFYSNANEINYYTESVVLIPECDNYLITPLKYSRFEMITKKNRLYLYRLK